MVSSTGSKEPGLALLYRGVGLRSDSLPNLLKPARALQTPQAGGRAYVLRKKPPGRTLPSAHAVDREYRVISALAATPVPVPRPVGPPEGGVAWGIRMRALGWPGMLPLSRRMPALVDLVGCPTQEPKTPSALLVAGSSRMQSAAARTTAQPRSSPCSGFMPAPAQVLLCEDPAVLGTPFYIMEHVKGEPPLAASTAHLLLASAAGCVGRELVPRWG